MNEQSILHIPDSRYCFPVSENQVILRLRMDKADEIENVELLYENKYLIQGNQLKIEMENKYEDNLFKYYETLLTLEDVRLAYVFRIYEKGNGYYFSEDGITETYDFSLGYFNFFQLPYINDADIHKEVPWMKNGVFYQIFVDRFYKGMENKDESYINLKWGEKPNPKSFAGGDLPGITKKLDYIKSLGVNALYLTPIFQSVSNHKYDISNYSLVDKQFGTNEDFKELVEEAHKREMKVVLDAVFNHASILLPEFQDVLKNGKASPYFDWFMIRGDKVDIEKLNYEVFAYCDYMPKFNTSNEEVQEFLLSVTKEWTVNYNIDGWRLDVSDEVSHDFWRKFRKKVKSLNPDCVIIGENWHDANPFLQGDQYDSIMNYAFTKACMDYYAFDTLDASGFAAKLNHLLMRNTRQVNRMMLNLLDSHDTHRFYTLLNKNKNRLLSALAVMCTFVGVPCIYYGTEICLEGGYDPDSRRCFDWNEENWDQDFIVILKQLLGLRKEKAIQSGEIRIIGKNNLLYIRRIWEGEEITFIANQSGESASVNVEEHILVQNGYKGTLLQADGFVICKRE